MAKEIGKDVNVQEVAVKVKYAFRDIRDVLLQTSLCLRGSPIPLSGAPLAMWVLGGEGGWGGVETDFSFIFP